MSQPEEFPIANDAAYLENMAKLLGDPAGAEDPGHGERQILIAAAKILLSKIKNRIKDLPV